MTPQKYELRISFRSMLIGLLVTVVPFSLVSIYVLTHSDQALEKMTGGQFHTLAASTATAVSQFVHDRVLDVGVVAAQPDIVDAAVSANRAYQGMSDEAIRARIERIDSAWNTPAMEEAVKGVLGSRSTRLMQRHRELDPRFLRITATDERGATIAATHKTLDYYQADEDYWQAIYAQGRGSVSITDILYDEVTKANYIGIGVPVLEPGSNRFLGTVDALIDVSTLFPLLNRQAGPGQRSMLVKDDGTIISAPQISLAQRVKSDEYAAIQEFLGTAEGRQIGYLEAPLRSGRTLIGFADTGLKQDYRALGWVVLVAQPSEEAFAPIRGIARLIAFMALFGLGMVALLGAYFAMHRWQEFDEIGEYRSTVGGQAAAAGK
jgi:hypothetical protein